MKSLFKVVMVLALGMGLCTTGAWAYTFPNPTLLEEYNPTPTGTWEYVIGDSSVFQIFGADLTNQSGIYHLTIFTNWSPSHNGYAGYSDVQTADLFLGTYGGSTWYAAVGLNPDKTADFQKVYYNPTITTSYDIFKGYPSGIGWGGVYDKANPTYVPVLGTSSGSGSGTTSVVWTSGSPNQVDITLSGITGFNPSDFSFLAASATCANSAIQGEVPICGSVLLLGTGLVGLVGLGLGRRKGKAG